MNKACGPILTLNKLLKTLFYLSIVLSYFCNDAGAVNTNRDKIQNGSTSFLGLAEGLGSEAGKRRFGGMLKRKGKLARFGRSIIDDGDVISEDIPEKDNADKSKYGEDEDNADTSSDNNDNGGDDSDNAPSDEGSDDASDDGGDGSDGNGGAGSDDGIDEGDDGGSGSDEEGDDSGSDDESNSDNSRRYKRSARDYDDDSGEESFVQYEDVVSDVMQNPETARPTFNAAGPNYATDVEDENLKWHQRWANSFRKFGDNVKEAFSKEKINNFFRRVKEGGEKLGENTKDAWIDFKSRFHKHPDNPGLELKELSDEDMVKEMEKLTNIPENHEESPESHGEKLKVGIKSVWMDVKSFFKKGYLAVSNRFSSDNVCPECKLRNGNGQMPATPQAPGNTYPDLSGETYPRSPATNQLGGEQREGLPMGYLPPSYVEMGQYPMPPQHPGYLYGQGGYYRGHPQVNNDNSDEVVKEKLMKLYSILAQDPFAMDRFLQQSQPRNTITSGSGMGPGYNRYDGNPGYVAPANPPNPQGYNGQEEASKAQPEAPTPEASTDADSVKLDEDDDDDLD
ncbi:hypothetical protein BdWA1_000365 [Babesia duncani]|uniref:Uncharacterized protein n=1 Tax=Babesia duncani TaxID=323732 RepID=A0AAD9UPU7_9APIC|nr:hypothetical protein BdWA1_000365 [Babesia duncani]